MLRHARSGEVRSFLEDADRAPSVGQRLTIVTLPGGGPDTPPESQYAPSDAGRWEVVQVDAVEDNPSRVIVYIRVR